MTDLRHWLKDAPPWLDVVFNECTAGGTEIETSDMEWLSEARSQELSAQIRTSLYEAIDTDYAFAPDIADTFRTRVDNTVVLAIGPTRRDIIAMGDRGIEFPSMILFDRTRSDELWLALDAMHSLLWIPAGTTQDTIDSAMAPYFTTDAPLLSEMPVVARGFAGTEETFASTFSEVGAYLLSAPTMSGLHWGSDYDEDPWYIATITGELGLDESIDPLVLSNMMYAYSAQRPGRIPSYSARTLWSNSIISIEDHDGHIVMQLRYRPCEHSHLIAQLNEVMGTTLPLDVPVDVAETMRDFLFETDAMIRDELNQATETEEKMLHLRALAALEHNDLRFGDVLREYASSELAVERHTAATLAHQLGYQFLLFEMYASESDEEIRSYLRDLCEFDATITFDDELN